jgi:hypothetical protein
MRLYAEGDGWDGMMRDLRFSTAMLKASVVHAEIAQPLVAHLTTWKTLDDERASVEGDEVDTNAVVAWVDLKLDGVTGRFAAQVLADCGGKREHATFQTFFAKPAHELKRLGLKSQVEAMKDFPERATEVKLSKASAGVVREMSAVMDESAAPLARRETVTRAQARVGRKQAQWRDEANKLRRSAKAALDDYAAKNDLPRDYPDAFFPTTAPAKKKPAKDEGDDGDAPKPDEG